MPNVEMLELLRDMERDFQLLKARGIEPRDKDFGVAHSIMSKVSANEEFKNTQSYPISSTKTSDIGESQEKDISHKNN